MPQQRISSSLSILGSALSLALILLAATSQAAIQPLDRIVAIVNDDVITETDLGQEMLTIVTQLRETSTSLPPVNVLRRQVLERLVIKQLQLQLARRTGLRVDDDTLNESLRKIASNNDLTLIQFRDVVESSGMSFETFRENMRDEITISRLRRREVDGRILVTDQEIDNFLEFQGGVSDADWLRYHLSHILIALPEAATPEQIGAARGRADDVVSELRAGADFKELAVSVSDGRQALEGGDLGWRTLTQVPTVFVDWVRQMDVDEVSDPIRSPSGFHIIKLLDRKGNERRMSTQTLVRHILVQPNEMTTDFEARIRLAQLKSRIEDGEFFGDLARAHSDDKTSAIKGGDLGWNSPGTMVLEFEEKMDGMRVGQISTPFQSRFGWHIIQVMDRREEDITEEYNRTQAREEIRKRKAEEDLELWLRELRDEAYVEYRLEERG